MRKPTGLLDLPAWGEVKWVFWTTRCNAGALGLLNGGTLPAPSVTPPAPFGFAPTTDDMIQRARAQLAAQQRNPPPVGDIGPWAPPWIDLGGDHPTGGTAWGNKAADVASKVAYGLMRNAVTGLVTLPKRLFDAERESFEHTYGPGPATISDSDPPWQDPLPAVAAETALMMVGGAGGMPGEINALRSGAKVTRGAETLPMDQASRMARAKQMGFHTEMPLYHGTAPTKEFNSFDRARSGDTTSAAPARLGVFASLQPDVAEDFAHLAASKEGAGYPVLYPLLHRSDRPAALTLSGNETNHEVAATLAQAWDDGYTSVLFRNYTSPGGKTPRDIVVVKDPNQLRSPFAKFDPAKRDSSFLLGSGSTNGKVSASIQGANASSSGQ
jgi:hypothetical protein